MDELVLAANRAFYHAFETLEMREMEKRWLQESYITCRPSGLAAVVRLGAGDGQLGADLCQYGVDGGLP